jgi:hypothetical protein
MAQALPDPLIKYYYKIKYMKLDTIIKRLSSYLTSSSGAPWYIIMDITRKTLLKGKAE